jgi:hypothetical protein
MWKSGDCRSLWTGGVPKTESCDSWPSRLSSQFTKIRPPQVPGLFLKMATLEKLSGTMSGQYQATGAPLSCNSLVRSG